MAGHRADRVPGWAAVPLGQKMTRRVGGVEASPGGDLGPGAREVGPDAAVRAWARYKCEFLGGRDLTASQCCRSALVRGGLKLRMGCLSAGVSPGAREAHSASTS
eukprot:7677105-Alexandrium_andersonii.AAC.1